MIVEINLTTERISSLPIKQTQCEGSVNGGYTCFLVSLKLNLLLQGFL